MDRRNHCRTAVFFLLCTLCAAFMVYPAWIQTAMGFCSVSAESEQEYLYEDAIYYKITAQKEVTITRSRASVKEAVIPEELGGYPVTAIQSYAFRNRTQLKRVVLPNTVREIGDYAFYQCAKLTDVEIPDSVEQVGWGILKETPWLEQNEQEFVTVGNHILIGYHGTGGAVVVPDTVTALAGYAFADCATVTDVVLPDHLKEIPAFAFDHCTALRHVTLPAQLEKIGEYAFHWCSNLEQIAIPDQVTAVGHHAFFKCGKLQQVQLPEGLTRLENAVFAGCQVLSAIQLPNSLERIGNQAFYECAALQEIQLPKTVSYVGKSAFCNCTALQKIVIENPDCQIFDEDLTIFQEAVIYGRLDSYAKSYAQRYDRLFIPLDAAQLGDVDGNGSIELTDATLALTEYAQQAVLADSILTTDQMLRADVNQNERIDLADATLILTYYAEHAVGNDVTFEMLQKK